LDSPVRFAGCSVAVALLVGARLVIGALGGTRCVLCSPPAPESPAINSANTRTVSSAPAKSWSVMAVVGGTQHTLASKDERLRVASAGRQLLGGAMSACEDETAAAEVRPRSASLAELEAVPQEQAREMLRVSRATNPFAALNIAKAELREGPAAIRRLFRRKSLVVHPDKVAEAGKQRAIAVFAKLERSAGEVEAMLSADAEATLLLAEVEKANDETPLAADPAAAARLLGVPEGSSADAIQQVVLQRYHSAFGRLQNVCPASVAHGLEILAIAEEAVVRGTTLWTPTPEDEAVLVTRALGCCDLKAPATVFTTGMDTATVQLTPGSRYALALLADGASLLSDAEVSRRLQEQEGRPKAAALRITLDSVAAQQGAKCPIDAVGGVCAFFDAAAAPPPGDVAPPPPKRPNVSARPERVRVSHMLLKWASLKDVDQCGRPGMPPATRTQAEAEQTLLDVLEETLACDQKARGARFKAAVSKFSECASAMNAPHADLGWIEQKGADPVLEAAAFGTPVNGLSDIFVTRRGAHLLYRLA